jgi:hypothetical protein
VRADVKTLINKVKKKLKRKDHFEDLNIRKGKVKLSL